MRTALVVLFLTFLAFSAAQDDCHTHSDAHRIITLASANGADGVVDHVVPLAGEAEVTALVSRLYSIVRTSVSNFFINFAVGFENDDYVSILSCSEGTVCPTTSGYAHFVGVRSHSIYNDTLIHYYYLNGDGTFDFGSEFATDPAYFPTQRPWFTTEGWTDYYNFAAMNTRGQTLSFFFNVDGSKTVLMADRISTEPCGPTLNRSPAIPAATSLANDHIVASFIGITDQMDVIRAAQVLLESFLIPFQVGQAIMAVGVGLENGDSYWINDCNAYPERVTDSNCEGTRYYALVVNSAVYGDNKGRYFNLSPAGHITSALRVGESYDPTTRPWFLLGNGWTPVYSFAWFDFESRTFASSFVGGVVAADINPEASLDVDCTPEPVPEPCPAPTPSPVPAPPCGCEKKKPSYQHGRTIININYNQ